MNAQEERTCPVQPEGSGDRAEERWYLRLYIAGMNQLARKAIQNLEKICAKHLEGRYTLQIIDLIEQPHLAEGDQIIAVPTLVRRLPPPLRKIIGDLSEKDKVFVGLDIFPRD